jgi:hypothetical protein
MKRRVGPLSWDEARRIGRETARHLDTYSTLDEVALELGTTPQMVCHLSYVALGKLVVLMRNARVPT